MQRFAKRTLTKLIVISHLGYLKFRRDCLHFNVPTKKCHQCLNEKFEITSNTQNSVTKLNTKSLYQNKFTLVCCNRMDWGLTSTSRFLLDILLKSGASCSLILFHSTGNQLYCIVLYCIAAIIYLTYKLNPRLYFRGLKPSCNYFKY